MEQRLTANQISSFVKTKEDLYEALQRNQFFMPPLRDNIVTQDFMIGILEGKYWLMRTIDVRWRNCPDPPKKLDLLTFVIEELEKVMYSQQFRLITDHELKARENTIKRIRKHPPCRAWLLIMLSSLDVHHRIFEKDYRRPREEKEQLLGTIANPEKFFEGLPESMRRSRRMRIKLISKEMKDKHQIDQLKKRQVHIQNQIQAKEIKLNQVNEESSDHADHSQAQGYNEELLDNDIDPLRIVREQIDEDAISFHESDYGEIANSMLRDIEQSNQLGTDADANADAEDFDDAVDIGVAGDGNFDQQANQMNPFTGASIPRTPSKTVSKQQFQLKRSARIQKQKQKQSTGNTFKMQGVVTMNQSSHFGQM